MLNTTAPPPQATFSGKLDLASFAYNAADNDNGADRNSRVISPGQTPAAFSNRQTAAVVARQPTQSSTCKRRRAASVADSSAEKAAAPPQKRTKTTASASLPNAQLSTRISKPSASKVAASGKAVSKNNSTTATTTLALGLRTRSAPTSTRPPTISTHNQLPLSAPPPSPYSLLRDRLATNLLILFVGLNPGLQTAATGHHYAHPSNLFWRLLYRSNLTAGVRVSPVDDETLPWRFGGLGLTNIAVRPTRRGAELALCELDSGVDELHRKARETRAECVCLVGKGVWESVWRVMNGVGTGLGQEDGKGGKRRKVRAFPKVGFSYGWQGEDVRMGADPEAGWKGARVFVASSTSGLAAGLKPAEKERIWRELGKWAEVRREEREQESLKRTEMWLARQGSEDDFRPDSVELSHEHIAGAESRQ